MSSVEKVKHWTSGSVDDYLYRIAFDFVQFIESVMEQEDVTQNELATRLGVSEGRVSQVLNNPGNLTLKKLVEYALAVNRKVSIIGYDDGDHSASCGPINGQVFEACWAKLGKPVDFFAVDACERNATVYVQIKLNELALNERGQALNEGAYTGVAIRPFKVASTQSRQLGPVTSTPGDQFFGLEGVQH